MAFVLLAKPTHSIRYYLRCLLTMNDGCIELKLFLDVCAGNLCIATTIIINAEGYTEIFN